MSILGNPFTALTETIDTLSGDTMSIPHGTSISSVDAKYRNESAKQERATRYGRYGRLVPVPLAVQTMRDRLDGAKANRIRMSIHRNFDEPMADSHRTNQWNAALNRKQRKNLSIRNWQPW